MGVAYAFQSATLVAMPAPPNVEIRRATPAELRDAYRMVSEYYEAAAVQKRETLEEFSRDYFCCGAGFWLARSGDNIIGCVALRHIAEPNAAEIKRMYVRPEARGQGVARQLLESAEGFAIAAGYQWIYLDTADDMKAAARFYQRNGFQPCERYNDNPQATIFMRKRLATSPRG
jgi:GNAT superfamily N-acetyltransferase